MNRQPQHGLDRDTILRALARMNDKLREHETIGEICLFGGTAMVLAFNARLSTRDVDAIFKPPAIFRLCAQEIAEELGLPASWLNDGVKGYVSAWPKYSGEGIPNFANLRVVRPTAEYLLAMKCIAARSTLYETKGDREDITFLIRHLGLKTREQVFEVVEQFYPRADILPKTQFMVAELLEELVLPPDNSSGKR